MRIQTTLVAAALLLPASAFAAGGSAALIKDCQDEKIDGAYNAADYRDALRDLPTDVDEYTNCRETLRAAQLGSASLRSAPAGGGAPAAGAGARSSGAGAQRGSGVALGAPAAGAVGSSASPPAAVSPDGRPGEAPAAGAPGGGASDGSVPAGAPPLAGDPAAAPAGPAAVVSGAGDEIPPTLALLLAGLAATLLVAAGAARRHRGR